MGVFKNLSSAIKLKSKQAAELSKALDSITELIKDEDKTWKDIYNAANNNVTLKKYCLKNKKKVHSIAGFAITTLINALRNGDCLKARKAFLLKLSEVDSNDGASIMAKRFKQLSNKSLNDDDKDLIESDVAVMKNAFFLEGLNEINEKYGGDKSENSFIDKKNKFGSFVNSKKFVLSHSAKVKTVMEYPKVAESAVALLKAMNDREKSSGAEYHLTEFSGSNAVFKNKRHITVDEKVTEIPKKAFLWCNLKSVKIPSSVTAIGEAAFLGCQYMEEVKIPSSVKTIGAEAFRACCNLESVKIEGNAVTIGENAFGESGLISIQIPGGVKIISDKTFSQCEHLNFVNISSGVTDIGEAVFENCSQLKEIIIPESVTKIGNFAFFRCEQLKKIKSLGSITRINLGLFSGCVQLNEITIPESVTEIGESAFKGCTKLKEIIIPKSVTKIGASAFQGCTQLEEITIPENADLYAFADCLKLKKVIISKSDSNKNEKFASCFGEIAKNVFSNCPKLKMIIYEGEKYNSIDEFLEAQKRDK